MGRYSLETTRALQRARPDWRYTLFSNRADLLSWADGGAVVVSTRLPTHRAVARVGWLHTVAALSAVRHAPDVWFSPSFVLPLWWRGRAVVTIHDLTFMLLPGRYRGRANAWYATHATRRSARHADRVLCGSRATRDLVMTHLGIDGAKVTVIPYGVAEPFFAKPAKRRPRCRRAWRPPPVRLVRGNLGGAQGHCDVARGPSSGQCDGRAPVSRDGGTARLGHTAAGPRDARGPEREVLRKTRRRGAGGAVQGRTRARLSV